MNTVVKKGIYRHFKGDYYLVEDIAINNIDDSEYVIYRALYGKNNLYTQPLKSFFESIDKQKYPNCKQTYRFELQNIESVNKK